MTEEKTTEVVEDTTATQEEVKTPDTNTEESTDTKEKPAETEESDDFDENLIDEDVRNHKPEEKPNDTEGDEIDPEDEAKISKIVKKQVGDQVQELTKRIAIDSFVSAHPEMAKYKGAAEKYLNHPTYSGIPIHNIFAIVSSKDAQKIGAAKERAAQRRVAETSVPGTTTRKPTIETQDWRTAPKDQFEAQKAKVLGRPGA